MLTSRCFAREFGHAGGQRCSPAVSCKNYMSHCRAVLREAIKLGGSSVNDYVDAEGEEGFFQLRHRVYGREASRAWICGTPIKRVIIAGRSSHYCPRCQK